MSLIDVTIDVEIDSVSERDVESVVAGTLRAEKSEMTLSVALVSDQTIHALNRQFLHHDYPTDVITFELDDEGPGVDAEIVVSVDTARRESEARKVSLKSEVLLYCVHGTLHLLGYDDQDPIDRERMSLRQSELLEEFGYETTE